MSGMGRVHLAAQEIIRSAMEEHYGDDAMESLMLVMLDADDAFESWLIDEYGGRVENVSEDMLVSEVFRDVAQEALTVGKVLRDDVSRYGGMDTP